ncbi:MAG: MFS transporter [Christensenella sp.]|uniref:MFS transporter n=1 Tax=Christensenella sp. TaxID=1935934 RepID=UPI002B20AD3F|nr:MFS transporter [Christensenella sp.]MEA5001949.1 MFS transporter [Christensenella sp.]
MIGNKKAAIASVYSLMFACAAVLVIISPMLDEIGSEFSLTTIEMGMLIAFQFIGFTIFTILGGIIADKVSKKAVLSVAVIANCILLFLFATVQSFSEVLTLLFFIGGGTGIMESMSTSMAADLNPLKRTFHINFIQAIFGVGALMMPLITGSALAAGVSWRSIYIGVGILYAAVAILFLLVKVPQPEQAGTISFKSVRSLLKNKYFVMTCICLFCYTGAEVGVWGWMSTFTKETMHFDVFASNLTVGLFWGMMILSRTLLSFASSKWSARKIAIVLAALSIPATLMVAMAASEPMVWVSIIMIGIFYSAQYPMILAHGTQDLKDSTGTVFAIAFASGGVGMSVAPYLMGVIGEAAGSRASLLLPAVLFGVIVLVQAVFYRSKKHMGGQTIASE